MKRILIAAAIAVFTINIPVAAADVGVSVSVGQPNFYGRIDIGDFPQPQVMFAQPVIIERGPMRPPIYLHVPPNHARHWSRHCGEYNACGERVFFVQDNWYNREYVPRYQERHGNRHDGGRNERRDDGRDEGRGNQGNDQRGRGRGNDEGRGRDH
ncbi:hypothetical protein [Sideroxydans sp. CL21]|uniref:hypothetical protein n=1 Tax=Sideroxydans sp. CL21 TaxID=2600596 RepID=UPI0024BCE629|nr:hypothetical protein [Sideroxydans sp. CL21]